MKKIFFLSCSILIVIFLSCCTKPGEPIENSETTDPQTLQIQDYFPVKQNTLYTYDGVGNEYASYTVVVDYTSQNKVQQRIDNGGTVTARVLELKDGTVSIVFSAGEIYYRENFLDVSGNKEEIQLMEPLKNGTTWTLPDSSKRTITNISSDVETPSGSYTAIEVTTDYKDSKTVDYYAKDVGLVKSVFTSEGMEISSSLSKVQENVPFVQSVRFFYPNVSDDKIYYIDKDIRFYTNDAAIDVLAAAYQEAVSSELGRVFTVNTKINSIHLGDDNIVYIDLNSAFTAEMNAGSGYESLILQSIVNTLGNYYQVNKVILTVENKPYESGHFAFKEGEAMNTNFENTVQAK